jgi:hypothetical protein
MTYVAGSLELKKKGGNVKSVECWLQAARLTRSGDAMFSDVRTVFTPPPFFFSVEPVASKFQTQVSPWADGTARLR